MNRLLLWLCVALWIGVIAWAGVIFYFSSLSGSQIEQIMPMQLWDKFEHFTAYAAGALLLAAALKFTLRWRWVRVFAVAAVSLSAFGATDEWHQLHTPGRSGGDPGDWVADTIGAMAGASAFCFLYARYSRKTAPAPH